MKKHLLALLTTMSFTNLYAQIELNHSNARDLVNALIDSRGQEVNLSGRNRLIDILNSQGYECSSIEASRTYPSQGKTGFVFLCDDGNNYALFWRDGKPVIYR